MTNPRDLPSVDQLWRTLEVTTLPPAVVKREIRAVLNQQRHAMRSGALSSGQPLEELVRQRLQSLTDLSLRQVINATGVVLHTNLGRAPLPRFEPLSGYSNLEYDLTAGRRGRRDEHLSPLLESLLGAAAIAVNNNAAAVYLALHELAAGNEVIISRGELIEIGDGFRIPDIMAHSGALLREVGTTNRTRLADYAHAISDRTRLILRVHPSNFRISGFAARPTLAELVALGKERNLPVFEDLGSGSLVDLRDVGVYEPTVAESLAAGANLVSFSCDKLLGGPQAGVIAGDSGLVARIRRNPMYRAFRLDKLVIQSLQGTLQHLLLGNWNCIPALRMIRAPLAEIHARAERIASQLSALSCDVSETTSLIGGGSTPDQTLPTWVVRLRVPAATAFAERLRRAATPVIARIEEDLVILDVRTVADDEESLLVSAVLAALA